MDWSRLIPQRSYAGFVRVSMSSLNAANSWSTLLNAAPFLCLAPFFVLFYLRRAGWKRRRRLGKKSLGFSPSTFTLGIALQNLQAFTHPNVEYVLQEKYDEDADEDGNGDPDDPKEQMKRQLRRIRLGQSVDRLILRLK
jgi:hypothetical protein